MPGHLGEGNLQAQIRALSSASLVGTGRVKVWAEICRIRMKKQSNKDTFTGKVQRQNVEVEQWEVYLKQKGGHPDKGCMWAAPEKRHSWKIGKKLKVRT